MNETLEAAWRIGEKHARIFSDWAAFDEAGAPEEDEGLRYKLILIQETGIRTYEAWIASSFGYGVEPLDEEGEEILKTCPNKWVLEKILDCLA